MTNGEAKIKFKNILMKEIDRLPTHYDEEIDEEVFDNTAEVNELLELNKIVCNALEKQIPKTPIDNGEQEWFECPTCGRAVVTYHNGKRHHCRCGQSLKWERIKNEHTKELWQLFCLEYCVENSCEDCDNCVLGKAIEALAKQQTTKYKHINTRYTHWGKCRHDKFRCETCGFTKEFTDNHTAQYKYCPSCGREINWSKPKGDSYDFAIIDEAAVQKGNRDD